jgi:hypothetical protein
VTKAELVQVMAEKANTSKAVAKRFRGDTEGWRQGDDGGLRHFHRDETKAPEGAKPSKRKRDPDPGREHSEVQGGEGTERKGGLTSALSMGG